MSHRRHTQYLKRQVDPSAIPTFSGVSGISAVDSEPTGVGGPLVIDTNAPSTITGGRTAPSFTSVPSPVLSTSTLFDPEPSSTSGIISAASKRPLTIGVVVAACIGTFVGAVLLISLSIWWCKRLPRVTSRSPNARGRVEQRQTHSLTWSKLREGQDRWEGDMQKVEMGHSQREADEKNFPMFKKTNSVRTAKALEEHGLNLPPFEFSKYQTSFADELKQPIQPFAPGQSNHNSWDRDTVGDDSFLSLRSVRMESGTMSPTLSAAKVTPAATSTGLETHKWESAEVLHTEAYEQQGSSGNPFSSVGEERSANPFFGAQEIHRSSSRRSRSSSRGSRTHSRNTSRASRATSRARAESQVDPFANEEFTISIPRFRAPANTDSIASGASGSAFASEHAMRSLIAALDLTQTQVEERLRIASMQGSQASRYSSVSGVSAVTANDEDDAATIKGFPLPPTTANSTAPSTNGH